jgi:hypothetical protein
MARSTSTLQEDTSAMSQDLSAPALVKLVHRYYPANLLSVHDARHAASEEEQRLVALRRTEWENNGPWNAFVQRLVHEFPESNVWDLPYLLYEPSRYVRVTVPGTGLTPGEGELKEVVCMLSVLAPAYCIFGSHQRSVNRRTVWNEMHFPPLPPEYQALEARLATLIESTFGLTRLPNDVLFTPVPDLTVEHRDLGKAQLIDCLFSTNRW